MIREIGACGDQALGRVSVDLGRERDEGGLASTRRLRAPWVSARLVILPPAVSSGSSDRALRSAPVTDSSSVLREGLRMVRRDLGEVRRTTTRSRRTPRSWGAPTHALLPPQLWSKLRSIDPSSQLPVVSLRSKTGAEGRDRTADTGFFSSSAGCPQVFADVRFEIK